MRAATIDPRVVVITTGTFPPSSPQSPLLNPLLINPLRQLQQSTINQPPNFSRGGGGGYRDDRGGGSSRYDDRSGGGSSRYDDRRDDRGGGGGSRGYGGDERRYDDRRVDDRRYHV